MAAAVSGLVGCSPKGGSASESTSGSSVSNVASGVPTNNGMAARNPQDEKFTAATTDFSALLQPLSIGGKKLRNRFVKPGAGSYTPDNGITQQTTGFYEGIAKGGTGLVIVEDCNWAYTGPEDVKAVVDAVHDGGALCGIQVWGM